MGFDCPLVSLTVAFVSIITDIGAGFFFRFPLGLLCATIGVSAGHSLAFILSRTLFQRRILDKVNSYKIFKVTMHTTACALSSACFTHAHTHTVRQSHTGRIFWARIRLIGVAVNSSNLTSPLWLQSINLGLAKQHGLWPALRLIIMTRLSPIFPFPALNYVYGVTQVRACDFDMTVSISYLCCDAIDFRCFYRFVLPSQVGFWPYFFGSFIGLFPHIIMEVYLGSLMHSITEVSTSMIIVSVPTNSYQLNPFLFSVASSGGRLKSQMVFCCQPHPLHRGHSPCWN